MTNVTGDSAAGSSAGMEMTDGRWQSFTLYREQILYLALLAARQVAVEEKRSDAAIDLTAQIRTEERRLSAHDRSGELTGVSYLERLLRLVTAHADQHDLWREDEML